MPQQQVTQALAQDDAGGRLAVSIVVPVKNESSNLAPLVAEIAAALSGRSFEVVYVNDGSTDATERESHAVMQDHSWLRQIRHEQPCGQSAAINRGRHGAWRTCRYVDGDGQNDPARIPALIAAFESGGPRVGLVAGQRVGRKATWFKKTQSRIANAVRSRVHPSIGGGHPCSLTCRTRSART